MLLEARQPALADVAVARPAPDLEAPAAQQQLALAGGEGGEADRAFGE